MAQLNRRDLLKVLGITTVGTTAACAKQDPENILPYLIPDNDYIPGTPVYYQTVCRECAASCGVTARNINGRLNKVDGTLADPQSHGGLCARGHSALQETYNVDRITKPLLNRAAATWEQALAWAGEGSEGAVYILSRSMTGSLAALTRQLAAARKGKALQYEGIHYDQALRASEGLWGKRQLPRYRLAEADLIVALDADLVETFQNPVALSKDLSAAKKRDEYRGFIFIGPRFSLTASNADLWVAPRPGGVSATALALLALVAEKKGVAAKVASVLAGQTPAQLAAGADLTLSRLESVAEALVAAQAPVVVAGTREPGGEACHSAAALLNDILGATGTRVVLGDNLAYDNLSTTAEVEAMLAALTAKDTLIAVDQDVRFLFGVDIPARLIQLTVAQNETTAKANLVLPLCSALESWGDAEPVAGFVKIQQPTTQPLPGYDARSIGDALLALAAAFGVVGMPADTMTLVRNAWTVANKPAGDDYQVLQSWYDSLRNGGYAIAVAAAPASTAKTVPVVLSKPVTAEYVLEVYPSSRFSDGRQADRPWLHELPDPISTLVWDAWVEVHPEVAARLGAAQGDKLTLKTATGSVELPMVIHPGQHPRLLALPSGYGKSTGTYTANVGANGFRLLRGSAGAMMAATTVSVRRQPSELVVIQPHTDQHDRGIAQVIPLAEIRNHGESDGASGGEEGQKRELQNMYDLHDHPEHRWGLAVDLDSCTGCGSCVTACDSENNVPIVGMQTDFPRAGQGTTAVGKQLLREGREMHWIRIERFFEPAEDGQIDLRFTPAMCQQCTNAPCETVCPVYATMHTQDGLNAMVYNRCVGTRYCSNNCVYKQRRFNWMTFDWPAPFLEGLNPQVTVRTKGVMEKCTFCVQRIKDAKLTARMEGRELRDGEIVTACQQTCPADALVFGDLKDPNSKVSRLASRDHSYRLFEELNTRPAVHYLKKVVRRPLDA